MPNALSIWSLGPAASTQRCFIPLAGLKKVLGAIDADRTSAIVLVTDGVANVGETKQRKFIELLAKKDVRLFTFIMGNSANRPLLQAGPRSSGLSWRGIRILDRNSSPS